ncbi:ras association domain-containing protein 7-like isoform X2 [Rhinoraja longicauda]
MHLLANTLTSEGEKSGNIKRTKRLHGSRCVDFKSNGHNGDKRENIAPGPRPLMPAWSGMELRVWVEGVQRVVCGVTLETSCQQVVIALAQAIGQTGRYVLVQSLRDTERQLLPTECPMQLLAKCGQYANDVRFLLRRTGSAQSDRSAPDPSGRTPTPTLAHAAFPLHRPDAQPPRRRELKKSLTFTGGAPETAPREKCRAKRAAGVEEGAAGNPPPSKDELFRLILRQQQRLRELSERRAGCDTETGVRQSEVEAEEQAARRSKEEEEEEEEMWECELRTEREREGELQRQLSQLRGKLQENVQRLQGLGSREQLLQQEIGREGERTRRAQRAGHQVTGVRLQADIQTKVQQNLQIQSSMVEVERSLQETERRLQAKTQELEELNKELRQCNLQQFIQQTGNTGAERPRNEEDLFSEDPEDPQPGNPAGSDTATRPTAMHFLGNPRNLQNPLVSSLNPGGVFV